MRGFHGMFMASRVMRRLTLTARAGGSKQRSRQECNHQPKLWSEALQ